MPDAAGKSLGGKKEISAYMCKKTCWSIIEGLPGHCILAIGLEIKQSKKNFGLTSSGITLKKTNQSVCAPLHMAFYSPHLPGVGGGGLGLGTVTVAGSLWVVTELVSKLLGLNVFTVPSA
jgi:hypothetical protein